MAFSLLGGRDQAMGFLNNTDAGLGGRPLDIAIADDAGFAKVEQVMRQIMNDQQ